jgi:hypothetical protein
MIPVLDATGTGGKSVLEGAELQAALTEIVTAVNAPSGTQPLPTGAATAAAQATIGTRAYSAGVTALACTTSDATSAAITTGSGEVLVHNRSTSANTAFIRVNATATANDIPVEPGEKFHLRITSGQTVHAICAAGTATLNLVPVT